MGVVSAFTLRRASGYVMPVVALISQIFFSFFQVGHCAEVTEWSLLPQLRHERAFVQAVPSWGASPHLAHRADCRQAELP